jgi:hypothetical protein
MADRLIFGDAGEAKSLLAGRIRSHCHRIRLDRCRHFRCHHRGCERPWDEAKNHLQFDIVAVEIGHLMRNVVFLAAMAGILFTVDAIHFRGRYRSEIWQEAIYKGQAFNREIELRIRRSLW